MVGKAVFGKVVVVCSVVVGNIVQGVAHHADLKKDLTEIVENSVLRSSHCEKLCITTGLVLNRAITCQLGMVHIPIHFLQDGWHHC